MNIFYNGKPLTVAEGAKASHVLQSQTVPPDSVCLLNGFAFSDDPLLKDND